MFAGTPVAGRRPRGSERRTTSPEPVLSNGVLPNAVWTRLAAGGTATASRHSGRASKEGLLVADQWTVINPELRAFGV